MNYPIRVLLALVAGLLAGGVLFADDLVFAKGSDWEVVSDDHQFAEGMALDAAGNFYFTDVPRAQLFKVDKDSGEKVLLDEATGRANGIAFGPDGRLYGCAGGDQKIYAWDPVDWSKTAVGEGTHSNDIAIRDDGTVFYTDPATNTVWRLAGGDFSRSQAAALEWKPNGIALTSDQKTLLVAEFDADKIHGFKIRENGELDPQSFVAYRLGVPADGRGKLDGMVALADGRLLSGTSLGLQVSAPESRGTAGPPLIVIPSPEGRPRCNYARISPDQRWVYTAYAKDVLRRKLNPDFFDGG